MQYTNDAVMQRRTMTNPDNGVTTYRHDGKRRLTVQQNPQNKVTTFSYDAGNRTTRLDLGSGLTYNADDQLVVKQSSAGTRKFIYDGKKLLLETKADDSTSLTYDFALNDEYGELTSRYHDATTDTDYYQYNGLGSTDALADDAEADLDTYVYRAFGAIAAQAASACPSHSPRNSLCPSRFTPKATYTSAARLGRLHCGQRSFRTPQVFF